MVIKFFDSHLGFRRLHLQPELDQAGIENSANQVDGNSLSVALSKRFSAPRASSK
jgi:hypothetical protein